MPTLILTSDQLKPLLTATPRPDQETDNATGSGLLRLLSTVERDLLSELMVERQFPRGAVIFEEGQRGDSAYLIWSGRVLIVKGELASPTVLGTRGPGEFIGEMALLEGQPRSASVVAIEDVRLLYLGRPELNRLLNASPVIRDSILGMLSARLRASDDARIAGGAVERQLSRRVTQLQTEKAQMQELQRLRQETSDLIVHDLRSPLATIYGALQMLELVLPEETLDENQGLLTVANSACSRMQRLVDSLLDVALLESGEVQLNLLPADLGALVAEVSTRETFALERKKITLQVDVAADLPPAVMDVERIDRVLANLLDNAAKYTPAGGRVMVSASAAPAGDQLLVAVTDSGPGIPADQRERIFERFAQVDTGKKGRTRGFGLGLAYCRLAVEAHHGRIWVEPGPGGKGSRFVFTLPSKA